MNARRAVPRAARIVVAIVAWLAILLQLVLTLQLANANGHSTRQGLVTFLSFFTILSNLFVALTASVPLIAPRTTPGRFFDRANVAGCAAASIAVVGIGYHLLLRHVWNPQGAQWLADVALHYAVPILFCLWWLLGPSATRLRWSAPLVWCAYPVAYCLWVFGRGAVTGLYPYPFVDVTRLGLVHALFNAAGLLVAFVLFGTLLVAVTRGRNDGR